MFILKCFKKLRHCFPAGPEIGELIGIYKPRLVRLQDIRVGVVYYGCILLICVYMLFHVLVLNKGWLETEYATGWNVLKVNNLPRSTSRSDPWDLYDGMTNPGEMGGAFIPLRIVVTRGQSSGFCPSPAHPCKTAADCDVGDEAIQRKECTGGRCVRMQWCPAEDLGSAQAEVHHLRVDSIALRIFNYVHFRRLGLDVSTMDEQDDVVFPKPRANTYLVKDLMHMAGFPPNVTAKNGAILFLTAVFQCNVDHKRCENKVEPRNVDTKAGFNHVVSQYYYDGKVRKRDTYRMYGLRIIANTNGIGSRFSVPLLVQQLASALAMLQIASVLTDFVLLHCLPQRRLYYDKKVNKVKADEPNPA